MTSHIVNDICDDLLPILGCRLSFISCLIMLMRLLVFSLVVVGVCVLVLIFVLG